MAANRAEFMGAFAREERNAGQAHPEGNKSPSARFYLIPDCLNLGTKTVQER